MYKPRGVLNDISLMINLPQDCKTGLNFVGVGDLSVPMVHPVSNRGEGYHSLQLVLHAAPPWTCSYECATLSAYAMAPR